LSYKGEHIPNI